MAQTSGFNPASMAMLVPNNGLGIVFPWAGAAAGTAFATGYVDLRQMIRIGAAATVVAALLTASVHLLFAPIL
jgi:di/tricarboxylate transporter